MNKELLSTLRQMTSASMKDCNDALVESNWDLNKAVDLIKIKGQNIVSGRAGRIASEGAIGITTINDQNKRFISMVEVNSQTDFVAKNLDFLSFVGIASDTFAAHLISGETWNGSTSSPLLEGLRNNLIATTKENIVVRRWWAEEAVSPLSKVFSYLHSNRQIGVLLTLLAPNETVFSSQEFNDLGNDLAMQIAAMNPLAVSPDRLSLSDISRQRSIFETQLKELNKPQSAWEKIIAGKFNKWHSEVCLLNQESIVFPKISVSQVIENLNKKFGGKIEVVNFIRAQVGENLEKSTEKLDEEVSKLMA